MRGEFEFHGVNYEKDIIYNMAVYVGDFSVLKNVRISKLHTAHFLLKDGQIVSVSGLRVKNLSVTWY